MRNNKTILVVEDEGAIRRLLELQFKMAGYKVLLATNGEEAFELIKSEHPDAVITDIAMPKMDGKTLCNLTDGIKSERRFLTIIVSGRTRPYDDAWAEKLRDTLIMEKPFSPTRLLETVDRYFGVVS